MTPNLKLQERIRTALNKAIDRRSVIATQAMEWRELCEKLSTGEVIEEVDRPFSAVTNQGLGLALSLELHSWLGLSHVNSAFSELQSP